MIRPSYCGAGTVLVLTAFCPDPGGLWIVMRAVMTQLAVNERTNMVVNNVVAVVTTRRVTRSRSTVA